MSLRPAIATAGALVAACGAIGVWAYARLPATAGIAVHFNFHGDPDGFAPKGLGLSLVPVIGGSVIAVVSAALLLAPRRKGLDDSTEVYGALLVGVAATFLVTQCAVVAQAINANFDIFRWIVATIGLLFVILGNLLGKLRYNYLLGVRTPWTIASERVWDKTHRFTGRLMLIAGVALVLGARFLPEHAQVIGLLVLCAAGPGVAGAIFSWRLSRRLSSDRRKVPS